MASGGSTAGSPAGGFSASGAAGKGSSGAGGSMPTAGTTGVAGSAAGSGGAPIGSSCTPNPSGALVANGDVVLDQKTCLYWMKESVGGMGLAAAKTYCEGLTRGGFDDWRVPIASEVASIVTKCGMYPPIDTNVFTISGDGIWTTTES
jgi:hypothetical protein